MENCPTEICFPAYHKSIYISPIVTYESMCNSTMCITKQEEQELGRYLKTRFFSRIGRYEYVLGNCSQPYHKTLPLLVFKDPPTPTTQVQNVQIPVQTQVEDSILVQTIAVTNHLFQTMRETMDSQPVFTRPSNADNLLDAGKINPGTTSTIDSTAALPTEGSQPITAQESPRTQSSATTSDTSSNFRLFQIYIPYILLSLYL
ncbi:hypothetical protein HK103_000742 [Boothiomyces macroporosus]|uniref:Uncharacterized protein n=1 Tax=Boothiomyces macroporosus TaxID=261099 RepID=A0AAD5UC66_9FUNG|nr:hypothetical protein HK103_000742 [Boothiomyces macroporosus]